MNEDKVCICDIAQEILSNEDRVSIHDLIVFPNYSESLEKRKFNDKLLISIDAYLNLSVFHRNDNIDSTLDYMILEALVLKESSKAVVIDGYELCQRIAEKILHDLNVKRVCVKAVNKPRMVLADACSFEIHRTIFDFPYIFENRIKCKKCKENDSVHLSLLKSSEWTCNIKKLDKVIISGIILPINIGILKAEKNILQQVNLTIVGELIQKVGKNPNLVVYQRNVVPMPVDITKVIRQVSEYMMNSVFGTIERATASLCDLIMGKCNELEKIYVNLNKNGVPSRANGCSVSIIRSRSNYLGINGPAEITELEE